MEAITKDQLSCIGAMITKLGLKEQKANIVAGISGGRCESSKGLTKQEGIELIKYLKSQDQDEAKAEKMRKKIISMAHQIGYRKPGTKQIDMVALDEWMVKYGKFHKKLNQCTLAELPQLVTQFEYYYNDHINKI